MAKVIFEKVHDIGCDQSDEKGCELDTNWYR